MPSTPTPASPAPASRNGGILDVNQWNTTNDKWPLSLLQPPTVYKDTLFIGWAGKDWADSEAPPGRVFAVDARNGRAEMDLRRAAGDAGADRPAPPMSGPRCPSIRRHGILYLPVSSPSPNYFGGNRPEKLPLATSVTALNADTGEVIWSRQLVHHDIWDYDTNSAPVLVDIEKDGKTIPALVQSSKQGFLYVLNRLTGEPIYPIEEKPVPASDIPRSRLRRRSPMSRRPTGDPGYNGRASPRSPTLPASAIAAARPTACATTAASRRRACKAR